MRPALLDFDQVPTLNRKEHRAIWYTTNKKAVLIDWRDQISCEQLDFCHGLPWKIAGWQPSRLQSTLLPADAIPEDQEADILDAQSLPTSIDYAVKRRGARARWIGANRIVHILNSTGLWTATCLVHQCTMYSRPIAISMCSDSHLTDVGGGILVTSGRSDFEQGCGHTFPTSGVPPIVLVPSHCIYRNPEGK